MSAPDHPAGRSVAAIEAALATSAVHRARIAVFTEDEMVVGVVSAVGAGWVIVHGDSDAMVWLTDVVAVDACPAVSR